MPMPPSSDTDDIFKDAGPIGGFGADSQLEPQIVDSDFLDEPAIGTEQDLSALAWVQDELRRSLDAANKALRRYVREADSLKGSDVDVVDPSVLRTARQQLHQGVGALELVGLPAAATLLRACELAVQRYIAKPTRVDAAGVEAIERASFALLDYIARMLAGKEVSPLSLFPQYKAVQETSGADRVHPADLWVHDWQWKDIPDDPSAEPRQPDAATRNLLEQQLLALMRGANARGSAATMSDICAGLGSGALRKDQALMWKLAAAFFEGLAKGLMATDVFSKRVASRLLAQFRIIERGGREVSERLAQDILFFCSQCEWVDDASIAPRLAAVRLAYGLESRAVVDYTAPSLGRFDPVWVAQAKKRVIAAKDTWSAVAAAELHRLPGLAEQFSLVGDSLERLFPGGGELAQELMNAVNQTLASEDAPPPLLAMEVATSILYVEAALDDIDFDTPEQERRIRRLAERIAAVRSGREPEPLEAWMEDVYHRVSDRQTMGSVVQELRAALSESEQLIDQYFRDPAEIKALQPVPSQLLSMRGVLAVLGMDHAQHAVSRMSEDVEQMIADPKPLDDPERIATFERLADSLGALDFLIDMVAVQPQLAKSVFVYDAELGVLKALSGRAPGSRQAAAPRSEAPSAKQRLAEQVQSLASATPGEDIPLADVTRELSSLTQQAVAADQPALAATMSRAKSALENAEDASDIAAARDQLSAAMADFLMTASDPSGLETAPGKLPTPAAAAPASAPAEQADEEMLEVFLEEAREVIETARDSLRALDRAPEDLGEMTTLRRAFHTLKGSSRMVGLKAFGDAGWACEQVFNARLADQQSADRDLLDFSGQAIDYFESWIESIGAGRQDGGHTAEPIEAAAAALRRTGLHTQAIALPSAPAAAGLAPMGLPFDLPTADDLDLGLPSSFGTPSHTEAADPSAATDEFASADAALDEPVAPLAPSEAEEPFETLPVAATSELASFDDAGIDTSLPPEFASPPEQPFDFDLDLDLGRAPADPVALEALPGSDPLPDALADEFEQSMAELAQPAESSEPAPLPALDTMMEADVPIDMPDVIDDGLAERHAVLPEQFLVELPPSDHVSPFEKTEVLGRAPDTPLPTPELDIDLDAVQPLAGAESGSFNQQGFEPAELDRLDLEFPESVLPSESALAELGEPLPTADAEAVELTDQELAAFEAQALEPTPEPHDFVSSQTMALEEEALLEPFSERLAEDGTEPVAVTQSEAEAEAVAGTGDDPGSFDLSPQVLPELEPDQMPAELLPEPFEVAKPLAADESSPVHAEELAAPPELDALPQAEPEPWRFPEAANMEPSRRKADEAEQSLPEQPQPEPLVPSFVAHQSAEIDEAIASQLAELSEQPIDTPEELPAAQPVPAISETEAASAELEEQTGEQTRVVGPLSISIPLFNIYLNEADELSRRLITELSEWSMELHRPVGETSIALAHSLGGSSATVGYTELSQLARLLESALGRSQAMGRGEPAEAALFMDVAEEIRRLLHQFAAGFLKSPQQSILDRLAEHEVVSARKLEAMNVAAGLRSGHSDFSPLEPAQLSEFGSLHGAWSSEPAETADEPEALLERDADGTPNIEDVSEPNVLPELHESPELAHTQELADAEPSPDVPSAAELDELAEMLADPSKRLHEPAASALASMNRPLAIPDQVPVGYVQPEQQGGEEQPAAWMAREPLAVPFPTTAPAADDLPEGVAPAQEQAEAQAQAEHIDLDLGFSAADHIEPEPIYAALQAPEEEAPAAEQTPVEAQEPTPSNFAPSGFAEFAQVELKPLEELPSIESDLNRRLETLHFDEHTPVAPEADDDIDAVDAVDAELFPIFEEEAMDLLPRLETQMRQWARQPNEHQGAVPVMRTLHTFKGGARLAGAMRLGEMAHRMETAVETALRSPGDITSEVDALQVRADNLSAAFDALRRHEAQTYAQAFAESDHAPLPDLPLEPVATIEPDQPLAFGGEALHAEPEPARSIEPVSPEAFEARPEPEPERELEHPPEIEPTPEFEPVAELLPGQEVPAETVEHTTPALPQALADFTPSEFNSIPVLQDVVEPADLPGNAELDKAVAPVAEKAPSIDWSRFHAAASGDTPAPAKAASGPAASSSVRVRAPLLERMVNQAGEVSITRARLESEVGLIKNSLGDLTDNLTRLREQLRDVEFQAETQLSSRLEAAKAASQAFDPLEFDRFTRLQELTRMMAESVNDVATVQRTLQRALENTEDQLAAQARLTRDLQDDLLRTRMVEFESLSDRLYRVVRQAAKETGKQVRLDIVGGSIDIDRGVLDRMTGAFEHLVRNAVTHGIELPADRSGAGKDPVGTIVIAVTHEGNEVGVEFRDDGGGLDLLRIREKGEALGLLDSTAPHSDSELANLIFAPGFSTAATITELAGRGVGMDVVRSEVTALGGRIETATAWGKGASFRLLLPLTTAVTQVVMLRSGDNVVAVPSTLVEIVRRATPAEIESAYRTGHFEAGDKPIPFFWLGALLQQGRGHVDASGRTLPVVLIRSAQQRVALHVDEVLGNQEVVVKNLGPQMSRMPGLVGITLLASGQMTLIYNPVALATLYGDSAQAAMQQPAEALVPASNEPKEQRAAAAPLVLVVDDSLTVRRVTQRLLVREGYRVTLAKDGLDALERLADERPAVVLSDIEMPRMDGFDLVRNIRGDAALRDLPVIMITSRIAQKHRDYAAELGVDHYLGKPYSEEDLIALIGNYVAKSELASQY